MSVQDRDMSSRERPRPIHELDNDFFVGAGFMCADGPDRHGAFKEYFATPHIYEDIRNRCGSAAKILLEPLIESSVVEYQTTQQRDPGGVIVCAASYPTSKRPGKWDRTLYNPDQRVYWAVPDPGTDLLCPSDEARQLQRTPNLLVNMAARLLLQVGEARIEVAEPNYLSVLERTQVHRRPASDPEELNRGRTVLALTLY